MDRAARLRWALLLGVAGLGLWLMLRDSTQDKIMAQLAVLSAALEQRPDESTEQRKTRLEAAFEHVFVEQPQIRIPDLPVRGANRSAVVEAALDATRGLEEVTVRFEQPTVTVNASRHEAQVQARAALAARSAEAGFRTDNREVRLTLHETAGAWKIQDVEVAAPSTVEPEARP